MPVPNFVKNGQPNFYEFVALEDTRTTALAKDGYGFIHTLTVTGGTAGTIVVYDNTEASGTVIANFASTNAIETYIFDERFQTGLVVSTTAVDTPRLNIAYL